MSGDKYTRVEGPSGEKLIVIVPKVRLVDQLPSLKEIAKEAAENGLDDRRVNDPWVRGDR